VSIDTNSQTSKIAELIIKHSPFLEGFIFNRFLEKNGMNLWIFTHKFPDYTFRVIFAEKNDTWRVKIFVYWKEKTNNLTLGAGKDFEYQAGPYNNISDAITDVQKKLNNNPIMGKHLYDDDFELNMDREAIHLMKQLKQYGQQLFSIKDPYFDDLKKIYNNIKNLPEDKFVDFCNIKNKKEADKQDFLLDLQKLHKVDYYMAMKNMGHMG